MQMVAPPSQGESLVGLVRRDPGCPQVCRAIEELVVRGFRQLASFRRFFARIPATTLFETLRDRICLLEYPPGTLLREATPAREFGVSRTPKRAILQRPLHLGLIESRDGVGTIASDPASQEIREIYQMRIRLGEGEHCESNA